LATAVGRFSRAGRSLLTFCRSVTGCCPRVGGQEGAFRNSDSPRNTSFVKSRRAACRSIALNRGGVPRWPKCTASRSTTPSRRHNDCRGKRRASGRNSGVGSIAGCGKGTKVEGDLCVWTVPPRAKVRRINSRNVFLTEIPPGWSRPMDLTKWPEPPRLPSAGP
jgi:hypothetical protein